MSGGVDSSVAASLLLEEGHEVSGVTLKLWGGESDAGCCSVEDVLDAARVAAQLGIDHHVFNMTEEFDHHVVEPFVADHLAGRTPNPCIECNRHLKFDHLLRATERLGFDRLATGHHARVEIGPSGPMLLRGRDHDKDQSYVLSMLAASQLRMIELPVGVLTKPEVRHHAATRGLRTSAKPDSQDLCFIDSRRGRGDFLAARATLTPGEVRESTTGRVVGHVDSVELVTVGQRRGLGLDDEGRRRVVVAVRPSDRSVLVAPPDEAMRRVVAVDPRRATWVDAPPLSGASLLVQLRAHGDVTAGIWTDGLVQLVEPVAPVAPGQTAAFYDPASPDRVVGSAKVIR
jgi:tRNA-specific 2-thiouridylase